MSRLGAGPAGRVGPCAKVKGVSVRRGGRFEGLRITPGALIVLGLEIGLSLVWVLSNDATQARLAEYLAATPANVFERYRVWTLATGVFLEPRFISLVLHAVVMWMFVPTLERFWGTARFYRFFAVTSFAGTLAGTAMGLLTGPRDLPIGGIDPFIYASIVAFGVLYARQPVQFFGVLPLTGRQLMYGFIGFLVLFIGLQQLWAPGAAFAAAMIAAAVMTSKRWSPGLVWRRWRIARARAKLSVIDGGVKPGRTDRPASSPRSKSTKSGDDSKWLN
jgi:membrane associated rhomboid family serine protease